MVHPLLIVGALLAKKAAAASIYYAGKRYGWARVYRRALEANKRLTPAAQQASVRHALRTVMHFPDQAAAALQNHWLYELGAKVVQERSVQSAAWAAASSLVRAGPGAAGDVAREVAKLLQRASPGAASWGGGQAAGKGGPELR